MKLLNKITSLFLAIVLCFSAAAMTACELFEDYVEDEEQGGDDQLLEVFRDPVDDNYRTFYQIFVGSFSDGNNDGIGDLMGVIKRMDYLNDGDINNGDDLGVQGIWLSPIFSSPTYHKYDAKDYYQGDWRFGDMTVLKQLIDLCHERNVKIILDLAINHTSNQHPWFLEFNEARMKGDTSNKYYDYYTCVTTSQKKGGVTYQQVPTTNFWYECNFSGSMPELNFDNPEVVKEMLDVAKFYLDMGIDGFRFDAVKYIYYGDTTRSVAFWESYMRELRAYKPDIYTIGECWSGETEIIKYLGATSCFNFAMAGAEGVAAVAAKGTNIGNFINYIESYQDKVQAKNPNAMPIQFLSNHDQDRIAGAFVTDGNMKMAASLYLLSPGSPVIYYGEEIGLRGSRGGEMTDANRRLAMRWGDFDLVKNPTGSTYPDSKQTSSNVSLQLADDNSILSHYQQLLSIRQRYPAVARGDYNAVSSANKNFGGFYVEYKGEVIGIFHNTSSGELKIDLSKCSGIDGHSFTQLCEVVGKGATLEGNILTIKGQTSVILK